MMLNVAKLHTDADINYNYHKAGTLTLPAVNACEEQCPLSSETEDALVAISKTKIRQTLSANFPKYFNT